MSDWHRIDAVNVVKRLGTDATAGQPTWQTMVFTTLALSQVWQALATRSLRDSLATVGLLSNALLLAMAVLVFGLQLAVVYLGFLQEFSRPSRSAPPTWPCVWRQAQSWFSPSSSRSG